MATFSGQAGAVASQPGLIELGGPVAVAPANPTLVLTNHLPYLAHLYTQQMAFKGNLGPLLTRPPLKYGLNSGYSPIVVELPVQPASTVIGTGDIMRLTEQGGDGSILYTGIVEDVADEYGAKPKHSIDLSPLVVELGDTPFSKAYVSADPAQMVRDAVATTAHLSYTDTTIPSSAIVGTYTFTHATVLDVLNVAKHIMGVNTWWHVDALGQVWFQPSNIALGVAHYTVAQGVHFSARRLKAPIGNLKNQVFAVGGVQAGGSAPLTSTYNDTSSQSAVGVRAHNPPLVFPTVIDQGTLNAITNSVGAMLHAKITTVELEIENFPQRIVIGKPGGALLRYIEPLIEPAQESGTGAGTYQGPYIVLDVEVDGPFQRVKVASTPTAQVSREDLDFEIGRILMRQSVLSLDYTAAALNSLGQLSGTGGLSTASSGARWVLNATEFAAYDANFPRVEMGNLAVNGISPAGWKFRANDAAGIPIFDSDGLIKVATQVANVTSTTTGNVVGAATETVIPGTTTGSFTPARSTTYLILCTLSGQCQDTGGGAVALDAGFYFHVNGAGNSIKGALDVKAAPLWGAMGTVSLFQVITLASGTYTVSAYYKPFAGAAQSYQYYDRAITVISMGS